MKTKRFEVLITETTLSRIYVEANTQEEAVELARDKWADGKADPLFSENMEMTVVETPQ